MNPFELPAACNKLFGSAREGLQGRAGRGKLRMTDFTTFTRQVTLPEPVESPDQIAAAAGRLLRAELGPSRMFRLVGVGVSGFSQDEEADPLQPRLPGI